ncbi:MAG: hypothetical protein AAF958_05155 [Planctomycetota bacterium]
MLLPFLSACDSSAPVTYDHPVGNHVWTGETYSGDLVYSLSVEVNDSRKPRSFTFTHDGDWKMASIELKRADVPEEEGIGWQPVKGDTLYKTNTRKYFTMSSAPNGATYYVRASNVYETYDLGKWTPFPE